MTRKLLRRAAVLSIAGGCAALFVPAACTIRLEQGTGSRDDAREQPTEPPGGMGDPGGQDGAGGGSGIPPEAEAELAAFDEVLQSSDPHELALLDLKTQYVSYAMAGVADPSVVDPAVVQESIDAYAPVVWEQAEQWVQTLDSVPSEP